MPRTRRRHVSAETEPAAAALDEVGCELAADVALRRHMAHRLRAGETLVDADAADIVRRSGWART